MDGFTWLSHPETSIPWQCPDAAVDDWRDMGWEPCDPPVEVNPAVAERIAYEREQQAAADAAQQPKPTKSAAVSADSKEK